MRPGRLGVPPVRAFELQRVSQPATSCFFDEPAERLEVFASPMLSSIEFFVADPDDRPCTVVLHLHALDIELENAHASWMFADEETFADAMIRPETSSVGVRGVCRACWWCPTSRSMQKFC